LQKRDGRQLCVVVSLYLPPLHPAAPSQMIASKGKTAMSLKNHKNKILREKVPADLLWQ
jgi:hypothetical protein